MGLGMMDFEIIRVVLFTTHKGVVGLLVPILEMRKLELRDVDSPDHSHRAGTLGSGDLK